MVTVPNVFGMSIAIITANYRAVEYTYNGHIGGGTSYQQPESGDRADPIDLTHDDEEDIYGLEGENGTQVDMGQQYTTRFIKAITDAKFAIRLSFDPEFSFLEDCDGIRVIMYLNNKEQSPITIPTETIVNAFGPPKFQTIYEKVISKLPCSRDGKRFFGEMRFARVQVDDDYGQDNAVDVGNIRIHIHRMVAKRKQVFPSSNRRIERALHRLNDQARARERADRTDSTGTPDVPDGTAFLKSETPKVTKKALYKAMKWTKWTASSEETKPSRGIKPTHVVEFIEPATKKPSRPRPPRQPRANVVGDLSCLTPSDDSPTAPQYRTEWKYEDTGASPTPFAKVCFEFRSDEEFTKKHMQLS